jgi:hypothetical protein
MRNTEEHMPCAALRSTGHSSVELAHCRPSVLLLSAWGDALEGRCMGASVAKGHAHSCLAERWRCFTSRVRSNWPGAALSKPKGA